MANNEEQIRQLVQDWTAAVRTRNMESIMAHHAEDIVMYDVPKPFQSVGREAYRKTWDMFFADTKPGVFDIEQLHVVSGEDVAFCFATMTCETKSNKADFALLHFRVTIGLKKMEGEWTIVHEHHSVPSE